MSKERKVGRKAGTAVDSPELREKFLEVLRQTGNVGVAAEVVNVYRTTPYQWKRKDPAFDKKWQEAMDAAADLAEAEVRRRAVEGFDEPVFYQGKVVGYVRKYSDRMLELYIKALKPEKYREKNNPEPNIVVQINGIEEIKALRKANPWGSKSEAQRESASSEPFFQPIVIQTEELKGREAEAAANGRLNAGKRGMLPSDEDVRETQDG